MFYTCEVYSSRRGIAASGMRPIAGAEMVVSASAAAFGKTQVTAGGRDTSGKTATARCSRARTPTAAAPALTRLKGRFGERPVGMTASLPRKRGSASFGVALAIGRDCRKCTASF